MASMKKIDRFFGFWTWKIFFGMIFFWVGKPHVLGKIQLGWKIPWEKTLGLEKYVGNCDWDGNYLGKNMWGVDFRINFPEILFGEVWQGSNLMLKCMVNFEDFDIMTPGWFVTRKVYHLQSRVDQYVFCLAKLRGCLNDLKVCTTTRYSTSKISVYKKSLRPGKSTAGTPKKWRFGSDDFPGQFGEISFPAVYFQGCSNQPVSYCWWKKSCTTMDVENHVSTGINYPSTGNFRISSINSRIKGMIFDSSWWKMFFLDSSSTSFTSTTGKIPRLAFRQTWWLFAVSRSLYYPWQIFQKTSHITRTAQFFTKSFSPLAGDLSFCLVPNDFGDEFQKPFFQDPGTWTNEDFMVPVLSGLCCYHLSNAKKNLVGWVI